MKLGDVIHWDSRNEAIFATVLAAMNFPTEIKRSICRSIIAQSFIMPMEVPPKAKKQSLTPRFWIFKTCFQRGIKSASSFVRG